LPRPAPFISSHTFVAPAQCLLYSSFALTAFQFLQKLTELLRRAAAPIEKCEETLDSLFEILGANLDMPEKRPFASPDVLYASLLFVGQLWRRTFDVS
jgi:hypothetical protein